MAQHWIDSRFVRALTNPVRREILETLMVTTSSPPELARDLNVPPQNVNYHVKVLVELDFIELVGTRRRRGAKEHFYKATPNTSFVKAIQWAEVPPAVRSTLLGSGLMSFMTQVIVSAKTGDFERDQQPTLTWFPIAVDQRGRDEIARLMDTTAARAQEIHEESAERSASWTELIPMAIMLAAFESGLPFDQTD